MLRCICVLIISTTAMSLSPPSSVVSSTVVAASRRINKQGCRCSGDNINEQVEYDMHRRKDEQLHHHEHIQHDQDCNCDRLRRLLSFLGILSAATTTHANDALAAIVDESYELDTRMNGFTRQIRKTVVRGAQAIDKIDSRWERFSDDFGLGDKRNQPKRNVIDAGGNERSKQVVKSRLNNGSVMLDQLFAEDLLKQCDTVFLACLKTQNIETTNSESLTLQIDHTKNKLQKSFFRASSPASAQEEFNFNCYVHFRVYNEILVKEKVYFPSFRKDFERRVGKLILKSALKEQIKMSQSQDSTTKNTATLNERLINALAATDDAATLLLNKGIIGSWERSIPPDDDIEDWTTNASKTTSTDVFWVSSDLEYSLALNGDVTLNSQLLLQELGYRLYPSFGRWLVHEAVLQCFGNESRVKVTMDDYYMDTSYNSNPDLFEVKQVLLNIVLERN